MIGQLVKPPACVLYSFPVLQLESVQSQKKQGDIPEQCS